VPFEWESIADAPKIAIGVVILAASIYSAAHALLHKSDSRAALGWLIACLGWPILGPAAYWFFGCNRIERRGQRLQARFPRSIVDPKKASGAALDTSVRPGELEDLSRIARAVTDRTLLSGNRVDLLCSGDEAYPAMLTAIRGAKKRIRLLSYIFDNDEVGREFADALASASARGVDVKVIVDGVGECYSWPRISTLMRRRGVDARRFLAPSLIPPSIHINLRNHRKLLIVDGGVAFTGGMNISDRHFVTSPRVKRPVVDLHFLVQGPVVAQMEEVFLEDWTFVTGDEHDVPGPDQIDAAGHSMCRAISDGPDEDLNKLKWILLGAISAAKKSVRIITPYFIPDSELVGALNGAALRGVEVEILVPQQLDVPVVGWASRAHLAFLLPFGVRIYEQPPPFVHSKLLIVDNHYSMIGSANLDPRSLRLNFEFNLEIYDRACAELLSQHFRETRDRSRVVTEAEIRDRHLLVRLRDALAFLFSPYL
jgi:cardiolipin synthase